MNEVTNDAELADTALIALHDVIDPEIGLNIVDLGLIYELDFDREKKHIKVTMTLTTQFCPMGETITGDTKDCLSDIYPDYTNEINLIFEPPWGMDCISPEGREFLGR